MKSCTFFGHRDCPDGIDEKLYCTIRRLIDEQGVDSFYVGNHGRFDQKVHAALIKTQQEYPHIRCAVVLAYLPKPMDDQRYGLPTIYPAGLETVPPRYAILRRNQWMLQRSEAVISYVTRSGGGAAKFCEMACKQGKTVINLFQA